MKQILRQVTVTGADDSIYPNSLLEFSAAYPFVEFGILVSKNNSGKAPRFPSQTWLDAVCKLKTYYPMQLSMHLCGSWVRSLCIGDGDVFKDWISAYFTMFNRIQLNFHGMPHRANVRFVRALMSAFNVPIIFQMDGVNDNLYHSSKTYHVDSYPLYDLSGGAGVLPDKWVKPIANYCGYAGGLSPDNLKDNLDKLCDLVGDTPIWIDAETHLRSDNDRVFDIDKVLRFLEIAKPYVIER